eukprot:749536-Hanusia_phi.AAC.2
MRNSDEVHGGNLIGSLDGLCHILCLYLLKFDLQFHSCMFPHLACRWLEDVAACKMLKDVGVVISGADI